MLFSTAVLLLLVLFFYGLVKAQPFLAPFAIAVILSLVVLPLSRKMENSMNRATASLLNTIMLLLISLGMVALVSLQVRNLVQDWPKIKNRMQPKIEQVKQFVIQNSPFDKEDLSSGGKKDASVIPVNTTGNKLVEPTGMLTAILGFLANYLLTFVYIFFLLFYRRRFKAFLLRIFPDEKEEKVRLTIVKSAKVAPRYLRGKLILMGVIAVLYAVGLGITGLNNFILITLISSLLTLIPYIGNIIAYVMAMAFGFLTSGDTSVLIGVTLTFGIAQFVQTYFMEPYLLGDAVDVHPLFVILVVVIGNLVWGVTGMVLAIPLMGIFTVILLHIDELHPLGLFFSRKKLE